MSKIGERLVASAKQAREIAQGRAKPAGVFVPPDVDVKHIRRGLGLSQEDFSAEFCISVNQVKDWEQGRSRPLGAARAYLMIIEQDPETVRSLLHSAKKAAA